MAKTSSLIDSNGVEAGVFAANGGANTPAANATCTAASPIVVATGAAHGFQAGELIKIVASGIAGLDGVRKVTAVADTTHYAVAFDNSAGGTVIKGNAISLMAFSSASALAGAANTQNKAYVVATFKNLINWDELMIELIGSAVNTAALTLDWMLQRPLNRDGTKWEDYFFVAGTNNTALDVVVNLPVSEVFSAAIAGVGNYAFKDTSASTNAVTVAPILTTTQLRPGHWGNALRLVIVPRAASLDGVQLLAAQVLLRGVRK